MNKEKKVSVQQNMMYNTVGSLVYYVCQWLMTVLVVRLADYEKAGILSVAMSVTAAPAIVGLFNIRSFQVSDLNEQYSIDTYFRSRVITNLLSYVICMVLVVVGGYDFQKSAVIYVFMLYKIAEGFADVYYGVEQKYERMDYAGISLGIRGIGTIAFFSLFLYFTKNLLLSIFTVSVFSFAVVFLYDYKIIRGWKRDETPKSDWLQVKNLLLTCIPLAIVAFLNNLSINIPKIFLEQYYGAEVMGYYSSVASPTVVIQLAATTVFAPLVPMLTQSFIKGEKKAFVNTLAKFSILVVVLSIICLIGSKLLAHWGLTLLFGEDITPYVYLFVPIIVVSIVIAINACLFSVCTLMRVIRLQYVVGIVGVIASTLLAITVVKDMGMIGVVYALLGTILLQIGVQLVLIIRELRKMI